MDLYEQKYKEALERAKHVHTTNVDENKKSTEYIFPELKELEDERIRKEFCKDIRTFIPNEKANKYIAWLEKQCHMLDPDKVIEWLENNQPSVCVFDKFKKDFGL